MARKIPVISEDGLSYDSMGRIQYHPEFHFSHRKPFTQEELEYLCRFYEVDDSRTMAFALGRTESTIMSKVSELKKQGQFDHYKQRWDKQYA
ncbi:DNA-entry nuclease [Brevibacillus centrosporus]|uniref:DNA-entry nuclease n=1 Tax=Brevibacillus centrosporus TaxID=54910 RepID=UPI002E20DDB3|nr:DNA-entry nuclease [Brevibacillus centrosporus]